MTYRYAPPTSIIFYGTFPMSDQKVMEISRDGIWVSPDVSVDKAAKTVLNAIDGHIKKLVQEAASQEREWVGLTAEEFDFLVPYCENKWDLADYRTFAEEIESKLKEKNT